MSALVLVLALVVDRALVFVLSGVAEPCISSSEPSNGAIVSNPNPVSIPVSNPVSNRVSVPDLLVVLKPVVNGAVADDEKTADADAAGNDDAGDVVVVCDDAAVTAAVAVAGGDSTSTTSLSV